MIRHILFPVDFSDPCTQTSAVVRKWAESFGASVTLLHVFETTGMFAVENPDLQSDIERLRAAGQAKLDNYLTAEFAGLTVQRVAIDGASGPAIVEFAAKEKADIVMMPTTGQSRFRQMLLGSATASVLHDCELPVWTCAHVDHTAVPASPKHILCAVDCGAETANIIFWGRYLANQFGATLKVVHSRPAIDPRFDSGIAERAHHLVVATAREDYAIATKDIPGAPELEIIEGTSLVAGVQSAIERENADLLVIGRGKIQGFMGRLRSNAHDLIRHSGCPVFSI